MEAQVIHTQQITARRLALPAIRWSSIFAGTVAGLATYLLLALFGIAVGLTTLSADPGTITVASAIWSAVTLFASTLLGGFVASRMSGLARRGDGMLHGLVTWATLMVALAWLATTALGALVGGSFTLLSNTAQITAGAAGGQGESSIESVISGSERGGSFSPQTVGALNERFQAGDRAGAIDILVQDMGFSRERAATVVDQLMPLLGPEGGAAANVAQSAGLASWWLFGTVAIGLLFGLWGGRMGIRANSDRTLGDHSDERQFRTY